MEFRTSFDIEPSQLKITHADPVMLIGSCFASSIGDKLAEGKIPAMINPSGTVYNPVSVSATVDSLVTKKTYSIDDLYNNEGTWLSFDHYTGFSSENSDKVLSSVNERAKMAHTFISSAKYLFVTFGTARVYRFKKSGKIVSNCHKVPAREFTHELLSVDEITTIWNRQLDNLKALYPGLKVIFSVSPVRHMKDGAHGNQVSKSTLFIAVEKLLEHKSSPGYFPAYELLMDDLRDYRFYASDMLHPSDEAVNYIWEAFSSCYFTRETRDLWNEISSVSKGVSHKLKSDSSSQSDRFARSMLANIDAIVKKVPGIDMGSERSYFNSLLNKAE
jgi:hypothetical protein